MKATEQVKCRGITVAKWEGDAMKTLNEVIKNLEDGTEHLSAMLISRETWSDSLRYLKVLKDILDPLKVKKISHEITCPQCHSVTAILLPESNEPLSWDELKAMEGKPVWIELLKGKWKGWDIIGGFDEDDFGVAMITVRGDDYYKADLGNTWQAYRKERE